MDPWIFRPSWRPRVTLIFLIACLYSGAVLISNELIFFWAADTSYRYWFYPPAGIRLILIMLVGWPGVIGYFIAALAILSSEMIPEVTSFGQAFFVAAARGISIWLGIIIYGQFTGVKNPWNRLTWMHVPFLALFVSLFSSLAAHITRGMLHIEAWESLMRGVALNVLGDTLGSMFILYILIKLRQDYVHHAESNPYLHTSRRTD